MLAESAPFGCEAETPPRVALRPERTELEARAEKRIALFVVFA